MEIGTRTTPFVSARGERFTEKQWFRRINGKIFAFTHREFDNAVVIIAVELSSAGPERLRHNFIFQKPIEITAKFQRVADARDFLALVKQQGYLSVHSSHDLEAREDA